VRRSGGRPQLEAREPAGRLRFRVDLDVDPAHPRRRRPAARPAQQRLHGGRVARHRRLHAKVIVITDAPSVAAAASADHVMLVRTSSASPFDSYTAAFSLCNALVTAVVQRRRKELGAALERGDALWEQHWNDVPAQPSAKKPPAA